MTALYRAYRPQRFDDVVGQQSAVRTLRNAIASDRVAHAYLFTGSKGTGKTTMAKLLAKAMNCEQGPTTDPCGVCESCVAIAEGRSVDVAEIDAASNNGIDAVREKIIDTVAYRPAAGTRRVYILDEAHQLSTSAFNALLKTIEEPPDHVIFVFCTTETHKMMGTVRDRCQRLALVPPTPEELFGVLQKVAAKEGIQADEAALRAIGRVAQGSFRNALGTLEMLSTAFDRSFTHADVLAHLGAFSEDLLFQAAEAVLTRDAGAVLRTVEQLVQDGSDLSQFAVELAAHLRTLLLTIHGVESAQVGVGDTQRLAAQAGTADVQLVLAAIDCLNDALSRIRVGSDPRLAVETSLVRACQGLGLPSLALRLAQVEQKLNGTYGQPLPGSASNGAGASAPGAPPAPAAAPAAAAAPEPAAPAAPAPPRAAPAPASSPAEPVGAGGARAQAAESRGATATVQVADAGELGEWWPRLVGASTGAMKATLASMTPVSIDERVLVLTSPVASMVTDKQRATISQQVEQLVGRRVSIDVRPSEDAVEDTPPAPAATQRDDDPSDALHAVDVDEFEPAAVPAGGGAPGGDDTDLGLFTSTFDATELPPK